MKITDFELLVGVIFTVCRWILIGLGCSFHAERVIFLQLEGVNLSVRSHGLRPARYRVHSHIETLDFYGFLIKIRVYTYKTVRFLWISH